MLRYVHRAPAQYWRAFLLIGVLAGTVFAAPPSKSTRAPSDFAKPTKADQVKGAALLREFRGLGLAGDYYLEFQLRVLPRRGEETIYTGHLWGSRNGMGPITRVAIQDAMGDRQHMLIQNGPVPAVWIWQDGQPVAQRATSDRLYEPILADTEFTLFDLQMPYVYWQDFTFQGVSKILGRAAHTFLMKAPEDMAANDQAPRAVKLQLDTQFRAMVQSALIDGEGKAYKTLSLRDLKKVDDQWMVKSIDLRNEKTRDKTRFQVMRAALNLDLSPHIFEPTSLAETVGPPTKTTSLGR